MSGRRSGPGATPACSGSTPSCTRTPRGRCGLQDIRALDALYVERYLRYVRTFIAPRVFDRFTGTELPVAFRGNPMFDALSVRAILSQHDLADVPRGSVCSAATATRASTRTRTVFPGPGSYTTFTSSEARTTRFAISSRERIARGAPSSWDGFDPRHAAVVENHGKAADEMLGALRGSQATCGPAPRDHVRIEEYSARSVALHVDAGCGGVLVLPDVYFPGWTATVNGEDRTVYATDGAFRGVVVPEGSLARRIPLRTAGLSDRDRLRGRRARSVPGRRCGLDPTKAGVGTPRAAGLQAP